MKRINIIRLTLITLLALSAITAANASAKEILFNAGAVGSTFTSKGGATAITALNGTELTCESVTNEGKIETAHLGSVKILFVGCKLHLLGTHVCTTNGSVEGHITINATFHLGLGDPGDKPALLLLPGTVTFVCAGITTEETGNIIGLLQNLKGEPLKIGEKVKSAFLLFKNDGTAGMQENTEFLLSLTSPESELMTGQHLTLTAAGTASEGANVGTDELEKFSTSSKEIELVEG